MRAPLLIELLTEELPPKALRALSEAFMREVMAELRQADLLSPASAGTCFATPRRLAMVIGDVAAQAPDSEVLVKGPSVKAGLDANGKPTPALSGFARKRGIAVEALVRIDDGKQEVFAHRDLARGAQLDAALGPRVEAALKRLPIPKVMRWGDGEAEFVRPVHGLVMMHGPRLVPGTVLGLASTTRTRGHRFLGSGAITLTGADDYERALRDKGHVIASFDARRATIVDGLRRAAGESAELVAGDALLDEITALVEAPAVYEGAFSPEFLEVPAECLVLSMQQHQKYVPLRDRVGGALLPRFLFVANIATDDASAIVRGNERVLNARLSDAKFFYDQDRKVRLEERVPRLTDVVYHNKLGSQLERTERVQLLAGKLARDIGARAVDAERAAWLSKADLLTGMVGEFPELQGVMGSFYARHDGETEAVVRALRDLYKVRAEADGDDLGPEALASACLYVAERVDALTGLFGIGQAPTGDKDPFGLRRAALALISAYEMLGASPHANPRALPDVRSLLEYSAAQFPAGRLAADVVDTVHAFILERYWHSLAAHHPKPIVDAVISQRPPLVEVNARVLAVREFQALPEAGSLAAANKRIRNILKGTNADSSRVDESRLEEAAERALFASMRRLEPRVAAGVAERDYTGALKALAGIRDEVDRFFDTVLVNAEDEGLRRNRHALLRELDRLMNCVADISKLAA